LAQLAAHRTFNPLVPSSSLGCPTNQLLESKIMGYKSEVAIGLTDNAVRLLEVIMKHHKGLKELCEASEGTIKFPDNCPDPTTDRHGVLYWSSIKWDDFYPDVGAVGEFLAMLPDEDYKFARIGENYDDNEEHGDFYDSGVYIDRRISW
jgi:hypothetical protein